MRIAVVLGTSKSDGNTRLLVDAFVAESDAQVFDLSDYKFSFFDYEHQNRGDAFIPLINELTCFDTYCICITSLLVFNVRAIKGFF
ncbi:hypothetical protein GCM10007916_25390 [Psychromonas marina]|uniref:NADPH-dependent FMN reductase-like domain-containing protein n=1 Tax=Psychromonas marina TaxID=88364 RepID=A0ABQ6E2Q0_9GAMM|nr:hypothetical protein GCM10007916_25390 [Psychromonas marina]